jgi:glucokinase
VRTGVAVGVDVGGTKLAAGLVAADGSVLDRVRHDTPRDDPVLIADLIAAVTADLRGRHGLADIPTGIGAAGLMDRQGVVKYSPNLPLTDFPLSKELAGLISGTITVDNDANVAAWGEYRIGAARGARDSMVMLTVGTGVGGGIVLADRLVRGAHGMAGELGHIAILEGGPPCPCGARGCLESLSSGTAIARAAREALERGRIGAAGPLAALRPDEVTGKAVTVAAHAGDEEAIAILADAGRWLGIGIASLVAAFDPEVVVLGGGAMQAGALLLEPAIQGAGDRLLGRGYRDLPPIVAAGLGDDAGIVGAALLALGDAGAPAVMSPP